MKKTILLLIILCSSTAMAIPVLHHDTLDGFEPNEHIDWTVDAAPNDIHINNIPVGSVDHNSLTGLQGGQADQYYHLNSSEYTELHEWLDEVALGANGSLESPGGIKFTGSGIFEAGLSTDGGFNFLTIDENKSLSDYLLADATRPLTADWSMGAFSITGGVDATFSGAIAGASFTDGFMTITGGIISSAINADWDAAYAHSQDNTQAHSDYLLNSGDDITSGILTAGGFITTGLIELPTTSSATVGVIRQNGTSLLHTYGTQNLFAGEGTGNFTVSGLGNTGTGYQCMGFLTDGNGNFGGGRRSLYLLTGGDNNVGLAGSLQNITIGSRNMGVGGECYNNVINGNDNIGVGTFVGYTMGGASSRNIVFGSKAAYWQSGVINDLLLIDNRLRTNAAEELTNAIIVGTMAATPAAQTLNINANLEVTQKCRIGDTTAPTNETLAVLGHCGIINGNEQRFYDVGNSNYVGFEAPALTGNQIWVLPAADGNADEILTTNGSGTLSFARMAKAIYAELSNSNDQTFAVGGTAYSITFNTNDEISGITHSTSSNPENITIVTSGVYTIFAQPQVAAAAGGAGVFHMWLQRDTGGGFADIANTNIELSLASLEEDVIPLATTFSLDAGDVIRLRASGGDTKINLAAQTPAGAPAIPSIIFTMFMIGT